MTCKLIPLANAQFPLVDSQRHVDVRSASSSDAVAAHEFLVPICAVLSLAISYFWGDFGALFVLDRRDGRDPS